MQIHNYHQEAQVSGIQSNKFGFEMNAKMYDILISKMYTNKQGAVIRELSANAWDAHVDAGKSDVPFEIHLPTWLDKSFHIRDYGTGIPHDKFEHIYTNVGSSTKEDSNELIGGFGLGSKTPFTMTDTFMVENWCDGIKTTWICYKDKGEPNVSKVSEESSDEPSGLKVSFTFDEGDVLEFTTQITRQLRYFPLKPVITGGEGEIKFPELPDGWETKEYFFETQDTGYHYRSKQSYLVMGNVCYRLDHYEFNHIKYRAVFTKGLTIKAPIGSVDIPPSREHLEMTPRTKAYITGVLDRILKVYVQEFQQKLNDCKTEFDVYKLVYDCNRSLLDSSDLTWKGEEFNISNYTTSYLKQVGQYRAYTLHSRYKQKYRTTHISLRKAIDGDYTYYVNDLGNGGRKHLNNVFGSHNFTDVIIFDLSFSKKEREATVSKARKEIKAEMGVEPKLLSDLVGFPPPPVKGTTNRTEPKQIFTLRDEVLSSCESLTAQLKEYSGDLPKDAYYVELKGRSAVSQLINLIDMLTYGLGLYLDKPLYLIRSKTIPKLDKSMVELSQKVIKKFLPRIKKDATKQRMGEINREVLTLPNDKFSEDVKEFGNPDIKLYDRYASIYLKHKLTKGDAYNLYRLITGNRLNLDFKPSDRLKELSNEYEEFQEFMWLIFSYSSVSHERRRNTLRKLINNGQ